MAEKDQMSERLSQIAEALGVAVEDLSNPQNRVTPELGCLDLIRSFLAIADPDDRKRVLDLAKRLRG